jgi:hypothetical protein
METETAAPLQIEAERPEHRDYCQLAAMTEERLAW